MDSDPVSDDDDDVAELLETAQLRRKQLAIQLALLEVDKEVAMLERRTSKRSGASTVSVSSPSNNSNVLRVQYIPRTEGHQQVWRIMNYQNYALPFVALPVFALEAWLEYIVHTLPRRVVAPCFPNFETLLGGVATLPRRVRPQVVKYELV
jgi:hypothetical protein